tara:strand:- start:7179 stop:8066 length:888 start_codon:yes stop_codon:yes gene_type:complete
MKKLFVLAFISSLLYAAPKQFPEENYIYRPRVDKGMGKYKAISMRGTKQLVLTYDDGPKVSTTPKILDVLKEFNAKATFFVLTERINETTMPIIKRIIDEGHILASHDHDHSNNNSEPKETFMKELRQTVRILEKIQDDNGINPVEMYYRFPYGAYGMNRAYHHMNAMKDVSQELYGENCINFAFWDIDTADWVSDVTAKDVAQGIRAHMEGGTAYTHKRVTLPNGRRTFRKSAYRISSEKAPKGGVVLMHDIHSKNIESTRLILTEAKEKGWEIIHLNEVKEYKYSPEKNCVLK